MGSKIYAKFIDLLQRWPIDKTRTGKDLGERLRQLVAQEFPQGPISKVNELKLNRDFESLNRIANNEYRDRFPRKFTDSTVFGWELEDYIAATSNEGIAFLNKETQKKKEEESEDDSPTYEK